MDSVWIVYEESMKTTFATQLGCTNNFFVRNLPITLSFDLSKTLIATMDINTLKQRSFESELQFTAVRSTGPGGQNVNKVSSKVELRFHVADSNVLNVVEKELISQKLASRINNDGQLVVTCQTERSQYRNKELVVEKFFQLLAAALTLPSERKPSKPTFASKIKRLEQKRHHSTRKESRRRFSDDE